MYFSLFTEPPGPAFGLNLKTYPGYQEIKEGKIILFVYLKKIYYYYEKNSSIFFE